MEDLHYPPGAEPVKPAEDAPAPEGDKAPEGDEPKAPEPEGDKPKPSEDKAPEAKKPDEPKDSPAPPLKKRSIYDDLKDERKKRKELEEENARLRGGDPAPTETPPAPKPGDKPADDLESYAQEQGLDAKALGRLVEIIQQRIPTAQLSEGEKKDLADLRTWRADQARQAEDTEILAQSPTIKTQLEIHDDAELQSVMKEIVKLAHTPEFHDKEVDYIVYKKRDELRKLVSPKKPSFESGDSKPMEGADAPTDFSSGKVTPAQAAQATQGGSKPGYEIRKAS